MPPEPNLTSCDVEPIHIPGSIQPHGLLLVADRDRLTVSHAAGDLEGRLGVEAWQGATLDALLGDEVAAAVGRMSQSGGAAGYAGQLHARSGELFDVSAHRTGERMIVELEPGMGAAAPASAVLGLLESAGASFQRASSLIDLCQRAAREFRAVTGFDRVMVYRFLGDDAGKVLAEDRAEGLPSFLNHHFPGSDIPRQARALYVRNRVRVIPEVGYVPAPLRPAMDAAELDMSDCALRSVSPIHVQYLKNMGVAASASVSIVVDGELWGLIACHSARPRLLTYDLRAACRTLAGGLSRQIKARAEAEAYRERVRLRGLEDEVRELLRQDDGLDLALSEHLDLVRRMLGADSFAAVSGGRVVRCAGACPTEAELVALAAWVQAEHAFGPLATDRLGESHAPARAYADVGSGLLAVSVPGDEPLILMWFRAERVQVVEWAGNPHAAVKVGEQGSLTPRASFEAWREQVRGQAEPWTTPETEAAARLGQTVLELRQQRRLRELNLRLREAVAEQEMLLEQKEVLLREMNHRVQNSLNLVSSFLALQARASDSAELQDALEEARRRLGAVAMAHRRLYRADQIETIDMARYVEDLWSDLSSSLGPEWTRATSLNLAPVSLRTDQAVALGLVLTELVINAAKYAYGGASGPLEISLEAADGRLRLVVADQGRGRGGAGAGFGSRMMAGLVHQLSGDLAYDDNRPGTRAVLTVPIG